MASGGVQDWVFWVTGAVLALGGVVLALWALFWDRSRGRKRCPKCWYDMSAAVAMVKDGGEEFVCPECGCRAASARRLLKTHRRWGWAAAACAMLIGDWGFSIWPDVKGRGWPAAVPSVVLVYCWPIDEMAWWHRSLERGAILTELEERLDHVEPARYNRDCFGTFDHFGGAMGHELRRAWLRRVQRAWDRRYGETSTTRLAVYELDGTLQELRAAGIDEIDFVKSLTDILREQVDMDHWVDNGGDIGWMGSFADTLMVETTPSNQDQVARWVWAVTGAARSWCVEHRNDPVDPGERQGQFWEFVKSGLPPEPDSE